MQWLGLCIFTAESTGSLGWGAMILQAMRYGQKINISLKKALCSVHKDPLIAWAEVLYCVYANEQIAHPPRARFPRQSRASSSVLIPRRCPDTVGRGETHGSAAGAGRGLLCCHCPVVEVTLRLSPFCSKQLCTGAPTTTTLSMWSCSSSMILTLESLMSKARSHFIGQPTTKTQARSTQCDAFW